MGVCVALFAMSCRREKKGPHGIQKAIVEVDFDTSMGKGTPDWKLSLANPDDVERYNFFKAIYEKNLPSKVESSSTPKIPKILHQIWLGPKNPPAYFFTFQEQWKKLHPDWEYHLWTDADLDGLHLEMRDLIDASPNFAERSDILRSELLERFGGVYFDVDIEPFYSLNDLHQKYDFYAGIEYPHKIATTGNMMWVGISIIGAAPHHPIIQRYKEYIRTRWEKVNETFVSCVERDINHTYFPFTYAVCEKIHEGNYTNMLFPATYFYPLSVIHAAKRRAPIRNIREKIFDFCEQIGLKAPRIFGKPCPETIAVHYWGNSWLPTPGEQIKDLQHELDLLKRDFYSLQQKMRQMEQAPVCTEEKRPCPELVGAAKSS
jgi:hypothetical protein